MEIRTILGRSLLMAVSLGLILIALQWPIQIITFAALDGSAAVEETARAYFAIRIWGAPATLASFVGAGLLIGLGKNRLLLGLQLFLNGLNIILDIVFAGGLGMGAAGIALGTVIAEWSAVLVGTWIIYHSLHVSHGSNEPFWSLQRIIDREKVKIAVAANLDIMIRTLLLVFSFAFFTNQSAQFGDMVLAANHILLQIISFAAFFLDGFAFVAEALVGKAYGANDRATFKAAVKRTSELAVGSGILLALIALVFGPLFVSVLTDIESVRSYASGLCYVAAIYILLSVAAFQLDGIFIGVSFTRQMRNAAIQSLGVFLLAWWLLIDVFAVKGLWWAMIIYVVARALCLLRYYPAIFPAKRELR
ncbi:MAG TPA: MATE family efflux transporter [Gammaproteobacteria bacterium]|nr:MATE family efflux transporter [Gammaproteobacteria bacterium]